MITKKRADALDGLRGLAICGMILSGTIAYKILPDWMYHAQLPPPDHKFNPNLPGLTWVDLVFPVFLFALGAAIPLALFGRIARGLNSKEIFLYIFKRGFFLGSFAIILQHFRPFTISSSPNSEVWWIALLGFGLLFLMYVKWPVSKKWEVFANGVTVVSWIVAILLTFVIEYPEGKGLLLDRSDIILIVLTNMSVIGGGIWYVTRNNIFLRFKILALVVGLQLASTVKDGWVGYFWNSSGIPWLFQFAYLKYLCVVIPGMIGGDLILVWLQKYDENESVFDNKWVFRMVLFLIVFQVLSLLVGLQLRFVWETNLFNLIVSIWIWFMLKNNKCVSSNSWLISSCYSWGIYWLGLGLILEPLEGGVKKDPVTYSYCFITVAIAFFMLIAFVIMIEVFKWRSGLVILIENGQNPMIGYIAFANLIWPILRLSDMERHILNYTQGALGGLVRGLVYTVIICLMVSFLSRRKLWWKT